MSAVSDLFAADLRRAYQMFAAYTCRDAEALGVVWREAAAVSATLDSTGALLAAAFHLAPELRERLGEMQASGEFHGRLEAQQPQDADLRRAYQMFAAYACCDQAALGVVWREAAAASATLDDTAAALIAVAFDLAPELRDRLGEMQAAAEFYRRQEVEP